MEKNIYDRQINKQGISDRVVDELNPQNLLSKKQVDVLMRSDVSRHFNMFATGLPVNNFKFISFSN